MTMTGTMMIASIEQSLHQMRLSSYQLEGVTNRLLSGSSEMRAIGLRLQQVLSVYQEEMHKIDYVIEQRDIASRSHEQREIGQRVQEAVNEISQI